MELIFGIAAVTLVTAYIWYTRIISRRNNALEALGSIDVQLRKRHDLIPNILKMVQKYMDHETSLLGRITELRAQVSEPYDKSNPDQVQKHLNSEAQLKQAVGSLFNAVAENYPDLNSSQNMLSAQETFSEVEGHISAARRFYNSAVTDLNNSVQIFPGSWIAQMANVRAMPYFEETDEAVRAPVNADNYLK